MNSLERGWVGCMQWLAAVVGQQRVASTVSKDALL